MTIDCLDLAAGQRLGVVGESGSGKTMAAMSIAGLAPGVVDVKGSIRLNGQETIDMTDRQLAASRRGLVGVIFQDPQRALNPMMRVGRQVAEAIRLHRRQSRAHIRARVLELLEQVQLPDPQKLMRRYPHQLSGGQRQRVMIAIAIACRPKLLIADEPTTALDATVQKEILELINDLSVQHNMGLLFVSHDLGVVRAVSEYMAVLYGGRLMEMGPIGHVLERSRHRYTEALIASNPGRVCVGTSEIGLGRRFIPIEGNVPSPGAFPQGCRFRGRCRHELPACVEEPRLTLLEDGHAFRCWNPTIMREAESHGSAC
ncbi:ABC transporter ATP-binding protein [Amycolatopsis bartoniae]|uniref:ABC transporter ATP-binding protein n=1 Tax=Amycolatopsis bartoniae TaxID=941986 RepID=UPI0021BD1C29|nr:ABC transporter ATP-binding protein [Amycolatopsis bartoniae]